MKARVIQRPVKWRTGLWTLILGLLLLPCARGVAADDPATGKDKIVAGRPHARIADIRVVIDAPATQQAHHADMAQRLIRLNPGDPLTEDAVEQSITALKLSRRFAAIHVDSITEAEGETLVYTLTPYRYIEDIHIRGNYPLFERQILNQMTLYPGDPYTRAELSSQSEAIVQRYRREGYIDPQVSIRALQDADDLNAVLVVDIDKGPHYILGTLRFEGNRGISATALKWRMKVWRYAVLPAIGRFSEYQLKQDIETLLQYYRRQGFVDAQLSYRIQVADHSRAVDVTVRVEEGLRYEVFFEGNRHFWDLTLKKDLVIFKEGNRSNIGVRKSIRNMKQRYREDGFLEARIETETATRAGDPVDLRHLRFFIHEGPATIVDTVEIAGNQAFSDAQIKEQLLTRPPTLFHDGAFVPETLEEDRFAVTTLYMKAGFQERTVDAEVNFSDDKTAVAVGLNIAEGPRTTIDSISITGLTVVPENKARQALIHKIGDPYRPAALQADKETLASLVSEKGYPHVTVHESVAFSQDRTRADIVYDVDPGPLVTLENIFISGNLRTDARIIQRELEVRPDTPLSLRTLYEGQRRLRDLAIFHGIDYRILGLKEQADTVDLFVDVEESKPYYAQVSTGYESDSGVFGRTAVGDRNLFGLDKHLWASGEISETGYRVETRLTEPRFLGSRISASIGVFNEELTEFNQPFGTRTSGGSLGFGREWGTHLTTALSFRLEQRDQFSVEDRPPGEADEQTRTIFVTTPYLRYDSRDSFIRPTRGLLSSLNVDISKGVQDQLDDFVRYQFDTRYFRSPVEGFTLAGLARVGHVIAYADSGLVPDDQLFFLGGIRDVRGYKENLLRFDEEGDPVGGKTAVVASLEARIDLGLNFELTTFYDIGSVQDAPVEDGSDAFRSSVGIGLRYITPIGPMGLLYGHKLDRQPGESAGRLHLSIGYSF